MPEDEATSTEALTQHPPGEANPLADLPTDDDPLGVGRWPTDRAVDWARARPWIVGCNYIPSYAVNSLEMWQAETFDPHAIDAELALAENLGFNTVRIFLHDLLWVDPDGLVQRLDQFLDIAARHGIDSMPVFFEGVWNNYAHPGKQPDPIPGVHNSQWVQSPSPNTAVDPAQWHRLEDYVSGVLARFADDPRVLLWDVYNEPGNEGLIANALPLLDAAFRWARSIGVDQPLTAAIWKYTPQFDELNRFQLLASDVLTFHHYADVSHLQWLIRSLRTQGRPIACTEYMARTAGSTFRTHLPIFRAEDVGCISWGLVTGRTQTRFPWGSPRGGGEPEPWFHDIFYEDHSPYDAEEVAFITQTCAAGTESGVAPHPPGPTGGSDEHHDDASQPDVAAGDAGPPIQA